MRNNIQNDVKLENVNYKKSKFNYSSTLNTSCNIGYMHPAKCQFLQPNSYSVVRAEELIRLAPLVAPTYAKQKLKNWFYYVPLADVCPNYEYMMTKKQANYNGTVFDVDALPAMRRKDLTAWLLTGSKCTLYVQTSLASGITTTATAWKMAPYQDSTSWKNIVDAVWNKYFQYDADGAPQLDIGHLLSMNVVNNSVFVPSGNKTPSTLCPRNDPAGYPYWENSAGYDVSSVVGLEGYDYLHFTDVTVEANNDTNVKVALAFSFSNFGKNLLKVLDVLGYGHDWCDESWVEISRLFAFYKAYFMSMFPQQWQNWQQTQCQLLISSLQGKSNAIFKDTNEWLPIWELFRNFILDELGCMWLTENPDYIGAHTLQPTISDVGMGAVFGINGATSDANGVPSTNITPPANTQNNSGIIQAPGSAPNGHAYQATVYHSFLDAEIMKRWAKLVNSNTVIGKSVAKVMRFLGLGDFLGRDRVNLLGLTETDIDVTTVTSTTDNFDAATSSGKQLGAYAGKAVGYKKQKAIRFSNDEAGYFFVMQAVTCDSGYCQGIDETVRQIQEHQFYQPLNDGLGFEMVNKDIIAGQLDVGGKEHVNYSHFSYNSPAGSPFGYRPRGAGYKVARNVVTGQFSMHSTRKDFMPYNMEKTIYPKATYSMPLEIGHDTETPNDKKFDIVSVLSPIDIPTAGLSWRYLGRFPWLGNLLRIFAAGGDEKLTQMRFAYAGMNGQFSKWWEYHYRVDDNYMVLQDWTMKTWSHMLPIDETYGTIDPDEKALEYVERC